jgi:hypothetical protein
MVPKKARRIFCLRVSDLCAESADIAGKPPQTLGNKKPGKLVSDPGSRQR